MQQVSIPKGTRDFTPEEMSVRSYIIETIRRTFRLYGYQQIETPALENLSTLMGKYGEEGDKLLFKVLNSGDYMKGVSAEDVAGGYVKMLGKVSKKGLRYDLTVPFARYVVQHRQEVRFPFRRYQIAPVWRADNPQRGRYREFYQCDADMVGSGSLEGEVELIELIDRVYGELGVKVVIKVNHRKVLEGLVESLGCREKLGVLVGGLDKVEKVGLEKVEGEWRRGGLSERAIAGGVKLVELSGSNAQKLGYLGEVVGGTGVGAAGVEELGYIVREVGKLGLVSEVEVDVKLARGLDYYTGAIMEVKALGVEMGSITGGGRYDNLTGIFGMPGVPGVGISFGADRIYDVVKGLGLYKGEVDGGGVLFVHTGGEYLGLIRGYMRALRDAGIRVEVYPDAVGLKKQLEYANGRKIRWVGIVGEREAGEGKVGLKDMLGGGQSLVTIAELQERVIAE